MVNTSRRTVVCVALAISAISMSTLAQDSEEGDDEILANTIDITHYPTTAATPQQDAIHHVHYSLRTVSYRVRGGALEFPTALTTTVPSGSDDVQMAIPVSANYSMATPPVTVDDSSGRYQQAASAATLVNVSGQAASVTRACDSEKGKTAPAIQDSNIAEQDGQQHNAREDIVLPRDAALPAEAVPSASRKPNTWMW